MSMMSKEPRIAVGPFDEDMTKQSMKAECDINRIVARYRKSGVVSHLAAGVPQYMDVSHVGDFREALSKVSQAQEFFAKLPARVRAFFGNDPAAFLDYAAEHGKDATEAKVREVAEVPAVKPAPVVEPPVVAPGA